MLVKGGTGSDIDAKVYWICIGSSNGLSPVQCQAIALDNANS